MKLKKIGTKWYVRFKDERGKWVRKSTGLADRAAAELIGQKWENNAALKRAGFEVPDGGMGGDGRDAEFDHRAETKKYEQHLIAGGRAENYVKSTISILRKIDDLTVDQVNKYLSSMRRDGRGDGTVHKSLTCIKIYDKWLYETGRIDKRRLEAVRVSKGEKKNKKRWLRRDEFEDLVAWLWTDAAEKTEKKRTFAPKHRAVVYAVAVQTGFRHEEIRALKIGDLVCNKINGNGRRNDTTSGVNGPAGDTTGGGDDTAGNGGSGLWQLCLDGGRTKNKRPAKQTITQDLARKIREVFIDSRAAWGERKQNRIGDRLFWSFPARSQAERIRIDLVNSLAWRQAQRESNSRSGPGKQNQTAGVDQSPNSSSDGSPGLQLNRDEGIEEINEIDFHSLRRTCGAILILSEKCNIKQVQKIMRHQSITLTLDTYFDILPEDYEGLVVEVFG